MRKVSTILAPPRARGGVRGGGGGMGNLGVIVVRVCEPLFQNVLHSYTWSLKKNGPIHIPDYPKCWPIHILPFDFLYPFIAGYKTTITIYSLNTKRTNLSSLEKSLSKKYVHILGCQKKWAFHIGLQKTRVIHIIFVEKRRPIIYLAALKKRAIRHAHPYYALYRKLPPLPPPPTTPCTLPPSSGWPWKSINRETNIFNYWNLLKHLVFRFSKYTYSLEHTQ